jgi:hypothetical protein
MKRRDFLATACIGGVVAAAFSPVSAQETPAKYEYFEIRKMTIRGSEKLKRMIDYNNEVMIPGLKRIGIGPFGFMVDDQQLNQSRNTELRDVYSFAPFRTMDELMGLRARFAQEADLVALSNEYQQGLSSKSPGFESQDRTLLRFFASVPKFEVPTQAADRVFEMRIYRSFNTERNTAKIKMFEEGGEIEIFRKCGINPVFFGNAVFGTFMPNITYMTGYENPAAMTKAWDTFRAHPDWLKLKDDPVYADTATEIKKICLRPLPGSQI